jgi:hypothetical protein
MAHNTNKKLKMINYTSRDFDSIKTELVNYAKRYYSDSFKDFNEAGFGALVLDSVAYVGDVLSFYLDYQANETFLETALEYDNVVKIARQLGYKYTDSPSSVGEVQIYVSIPADNVGAPNTYYYPTLRAGSQFSSVNGTLFTLTEDIYFGAEGNEILVNTVDASTGVPTQYAVKATGKVISGRMEREYIRVGEFTKFLQIPLSRVGVANMISVTDSEGHDYHEVSHLSQEIVYKAIRNNNADKNSVPSILKAISVPRRFVLERSRTKAFLQFGYGSDSELKNISIVDPNQIILEMYGRDYAPQRDFDPTNLTTTDKFGVAPSNTILTIVYRVNESVDVNSSSNSIIRVTTPILEFENQNTLDPGLRAAVFGSLEVNNENPILGDVSIPSATELKQRVASFYATQNRAVTAEDYKAITYAMPPSFGAVKRCVINRDFDAFRRNLNMYVISEDSTGNFIQTNSTIKQNLRTWLSRYKMINDTIDILNARIVNLAIEFSLVTDYSENKYAALSIANKRLRTYFSNTIFDIGEPFYITEIYKQLQNIPNVVDVLDVRIIPKEGGVYSDSTFNFDNYLSNDGRYIAAEPDVIFELKFPNIDVQGTVV